MLQTDQGVIEDGILVDVNDEPVAIASKLSGPGWQTSHRLAEDLGSCYAVASDNVICLLRPGDKIVLRDRGSGFIDEAVEGYDILVSILGEEFRQLVMNV